MPSSNNNANRNDAANSSGQNEAGAIRDRELQTYCRLIRFAFLLLVFWILILWLTEHHDDTLALILLGLLLLWFLYMVVSICCLCFTIRALTAPSEARDGILLNNDDHGDDDDENDQDGLLQYNFDDTPAKIRECNIPKRPGIAPKNGVYSVVYSAIYFGRAMRSEAKLTLDFQDKGATSGWEITGQADFKTQSSIDEGFVNAKGEMYWVTQNCVYRGVLDLETLTMYDGEFLSSTGNRGRVVRLEFVPSSDIEMSTIGGSLV